MSKGKLQFKKDLESIIKLVEGGHFDDKPLLIILFFATRKTEKGTYDMMDTYMSNLEKDDVIDMVEDWLERQKNE